MVQFPGLSQPGVCFSASPSATKGYVVRQVVADPFDNPSPSSGDYIEIYVGSAYSQGVISLTPTTTDPVIVPFDPGFAIPAGGAVGVKVFG